MIIRIMNKEIERYSSLKKQLAEIQINDQENKTNIALMFLAILNELGVNNGFKTSIEIEICL